MFFICGVSSGQKELKFSQLVVCQLCGSYGRCQAFMTYMCLSLFFIPILKWNRRYYVKMSCCGSVYELDKEIGQRIARGEVLEIPASALTLVQTMDTQNETWKGSFQAQRKHCPDCGYETTEDFAYCPKCGQKF